MGYSPPQILSRSRDFTAQPEAIEKKLRRRGGSQAASSLTHMNRHTQQTRRPKTKTKSKNKKTNEN
jgi:hypothetical protein